MPLRTYGFMLALIFLANGVAGPSRAEPFTAGGFSFSDELGGFRLTGLFGDGSLADPFVLVEEITGDIAAIVTIRRLTMPDNPKKWRPGAGRDVIYVAKSITNLTDKTWTCFDVELRQSLGQPSGYYDGLSFDQIGRNEADVTADRFNQRTRAFEPHDEIRFEDGRVEPGETLELSVPLSDLTPVAEFFLLQKPGTGSAVDPTRCGVQPVLS